MITRWRALLSAALAIGAIVCGRCWAQEGDWNPRQRLLKQLVADVPSILKSQNRQTGRFGTEPWIIDDQNAIFPLAVAWAIEDPANPYFHDAALLDAIIKGGDAMADAQDKEGRWTFRKKDNSTWGQSLKPWPLSRWMRAYLIVRDAMPAARREKWDRGLLLGCRRLAASLPKAEVHNINTFHAATLYGGGICFAHEDWKEIARRYMAKVAAAQSPAGWWSEHSGPVVAYNVVYVDALGLYYAWSRDAGVLEVLRRAAVYHAAFTYPNGSDVETVDERNPYQPYVFFGNVGFSFTPEGRGFLLRQSAFIGKGPGTSTLRTDEAASLLMYGASGAAAPPAAKQLYVMGDNQALTLSRKPWFICASAFTSGLSTSRWIQDRQNFLSVYHDDAGLIVGGGNTKLQPYWSNFTIGNPAMLQHRPGDANPSFKPRGGLIHMPSRARLMVDAAAPAVELTYGPETCRIAARPVDDARLTLTCEASANGDKPVEGHVVFLPRLKSTLKTAAGKALTTGSDAFELSPGDIGGSFIYGNVRVGCPAGATLRWPARRHNPYKKDGSSELDDARLVLCLSFSKDRQKQDVTLEILKAGSGSPSQGK